MPTMRAARLHAHTGVEGIRLDEIDRPSPKPGEVLIQVRAAGVNPVDWKIAGEMGRGFGLTLPHTLGCDMSGVVVEVGGGVDGFKRGDEVFGYTSLEREGAYAEFIVALETELAPKPANLDFEHAAAIPVAALTAWQGLFDMAGLEGGQTVLIHAAAGGVGSIAVQLAKARGARVLGTASARNEQFVRSLGVDEFIDYRSTPFEDVAKDVDVVLDAIGGETQERSFQCLRSGGFLVSIVEPPDQSLAEQHGVRAAFFAVQPDGRRLTEIAGMVERGEVSATVLEVRPLDEVKVALQENQEGHTRGKIVVRA